MINLPKIYNWLYSWWQDFQINLSNIWSHFFVRVYLLFSLVLNGLAWYFARYLRGIIGDSLAVLHYNIDFGIDFVGDSDKILVLPALGIFIVFFNLFLLFNFVKRQDFKFIAHFLFIAGLLANVLLLASLASIYLINFR